MRTKRLVLALSLALVCLLTVGLLPLGVLPTTAQAATANSTWNYDGDYYDRITATSGTQLLAQLHDLITSTHSHYTSYEECGNASSTELVYTSDPGSNSNSLMEFYTHEDISRTKFDVPGGWNREHVWPKSNSNGLWKNSTVGGGADLHHVRPAEKDLNNARGNLKYGEVSSAGSSAKYASGTHALGGYANSSTFEPLNNVKGDVARILFYVYTHYNTYTNSIFGGYAKTNGSGNASYFGTLQFTHNVTASNEAEAINLLLKWNANDPVDEIEITRNNAVAVSTGNRNPFIDNSGYAEAIWGNGSASSDNLQSLSVNPATASLSIGQTVNLTVSKTPAAASANLVWSSSNASVASVANGVVTANAIGTAIITVKDSATNISATATITIKDIEGISVTGTPTKTAYKAGDTFDPTGLTVTVNYTDGTHSATSLSACQWLDGTAMTTQLYQGTTDIICKMGNLMQVLHDVVTVEAAPALQSQTATINIGSFGSQGYDHNAWTAGDLAGTAYVYTSQNKIQMNSNQKSRYLANTTPIQDGIVSITVKTESAKKFQLWTSTSSYDQTNGVPKDATDHDEYSVDSKGYTWVLNTTDTYFTLSYTDSGVVFITSVEICYGVAGSSDPVEPPKPADSVGLDKSNITMEVGSTETLHAVATGEVSWTSSDTSVATVVNGVVTAVGKGTATITATCGTATATCNVSVGQNDVTPDDPTPDIPTPPPVESDWTAAKFNTAVASIASCTTQRAQFDAIKNALTIYSHLSQEDKNSVASSYETLNAAISSYNAKVAVQNNDMNKAVETAVSCIAVLSGALAALLILLKQKLL